MSKRLNLNLRGKLTRPVHRQFAAIFEGQRRFLSKVGRGLRLSLASFPFIVHSYARLILLSRIDGDAPRSKDFGAGVFGWFESRLISTSEAAP
jgi:hypothetical protein